MHNKHICVFSLFQVYSQNEVDDIFGRRLPDEKDPLTQRGKEWFRRNVPCDSDSMMRNVVRLYNLFPVIKMIQKYQWKVCS